MPSLVFEHGCLESCLEVEPGRRSESPLEVGGGEWVLRVVTQPCFLFSISAPCSGVPIATVENTPPPHLYH